MKELTTLFIGDAQSTEFSVAVKILAEQTRVNHFNDSSIAQQFLITDHITPDLIVLAQSYPGQYNAKEVQELRTRAPLTRIIVLLGTWCEGESRSGSPIGGTIRIYWHQFASQGGQELEQLRSGRCSTWGLDATATDDERLLLASSQGQRTLRQPGPGLVAIVTANRELALCLIDACRLQGIASTWYLPEQEIESASIAVVVWDAPAPNSPFPTSLQCFRNTSPQIPVIPLVGFRRVDDYADVYQASGLTTISKPFHFPGLFNHHFFSSSTSSQ